MNYLADTHILIWTLTGSDKLSSEGKRVVMDESI